MPQQEHYSYKEAREILAKARLPKRHGKRSSTYSAKRTKCSRNHNHPSKVEARVCEAVHLEWCSPHEVYRNVRLPAWSIGRTDAGIPHYVSVDFAVVEVVPMLHGTIFKIAYLCDAKLGKRSRDWERGRAALQTTYGVSVVERSQ